MYVHHWSIALRYNLSSEFSVCGARTSFFSHYFFLCCILREDDNPSYCSVYCYDPSLCVIATRNFIPLFMASLCFAYVISFHPFITNFFCLYKDCERISHHRYCHQLMPTLKWYSDKREKHTHNDEDKVLCIQNLDQVCYFFGAAFFCGRM